MILTCLKAVVEDLAKLAFRGEAFFFNFEKTNQGMPHRLAWLQYSVFFMNFVLCLGHIAWSVFFMSCVFCLVLTVLNLCVSWAVCCILFWLIDLYCSWLTCSVFCWFCLTHVCCELHVVSCVDCTWSCMCLGLHVMSCIDCAWCTYIEQLQVVFVPEFCCLMCLCVCVLCITLCLLTLCHSVYSLPPVGLEWKCTNNFYHIMTFLWVCDCTLFSFPHRLHNS